MAKTLVKYLLHQLLDIWVAHSKQLWISGNLHLPYVLAFIRYYKDELRNSKKGAAIPHLNKEIFYNLLIGIPPYEEQIRIAESVEQLSTHIVKL